MAKIALVNQEINAKACISHLRQVKRRMGEQLVAIFWDCDRIASKPTGIASSGELSVCREWNTAEYNASFGIYP